jgi:hypothetical protein
LETAHHHAHSHDEVPLDPAEAFQLLSFFLSDPSRQAAEELRPFLPDIRNIAFYYRFLMDASEFSDAQLSLVRQFVAQTYAAQQVLRRFADG